MDSKGQVSVDLLFATLIAIIIMGSFVALITGGTEKTETAEFGRARMIGEKIAESINTVYVNGRGYSINLTMPAVSDLNMTAQVMNNGYVNVYYQGRTTSIRLVPRQNISPITLSSGHMYRIRNNNGTITITQL
ncbi:MAG: hypothetical protein CIT01_00545 [Methanobacterium sp. BRmetb2]|jgi:uncharacterized protein (UPF0333 family)|nr:MAG: hypothetical protein CIT01_00545 [Methanobacterium sp. BRmetb2]